MSGFEWTDERVTRLRELWALGWSASQVCKELGATSRSAVCGKVNRLGMSNSPERSLITQTISNAPRRVARRTRAAPKPRTPRADVAASGIVRRAEARRRDPGHAALPPPPPIDVTNARPWTTRRFGECAFPVAGEGADTLSCCAPTEGTYCPAHHAVMVRPDQPTKRDTMRIARIAA
jgi:GcrA cell cycle regulator